MGRSIVNLSCHARPEFLLFIYLSKAFLNVLTAARVFESATNCGGLNVADSDVEKYVTFVIGTPGLFGTDQC